MLNSRLDIKAYKTKATNLADVYRTFPVLVPSEAKTLHLYEARYIALLEESLFRKNKLFVHFVLDPIGSSGTSSETSFAARYGCLVIIEKVEQLEIGALISIRGVGRVKLLEFKQAPGEASLQTQTINSLFWAENQQSLDCNTDFIPPVAERVSFAALQPVSGATKSELLKLQREKLTAMDVTDTLVRLEKAVELVRDNTAILAAKLAIQSLDMR
ncbi:UNVERIFIED_CONTAM: hypothetical protein Sindi_1364500 [Sesamum indicum]